MCETLVSVVSESVSLTDMMGCIGSQLSRVLHPSPSSSSSSRPHPSTHTSFQVFNVDDLGRHQVPGKLEVTDTDLVLRVPGKTPLTWPLRSLRRYGYEHDLFSFESGRRCPTGAGIYAFKCNRAQHIFNLLQAKIQEGNLSVPLPLPPPLIPPNPHSDDPEPLTPSSSSPAFDYVNISDPHPLPLSASTHTRPPPPEGETDTEPESPLSPHPHPNPLYMNVESQKKGVRGNPVPPPLPNYQNQNHHVGGVGGGGVFEWNGASKSKVKVNGHHRRLGDAPTPSAPLFYHNDLNFNQKGSGSGGGGGCGGEDEGGSIYYTNVECPRRSSVSSPTTPEVNYAELDLEQSQRKGVGVRGDERNEATPGTPQHSVSRVLKGWVDKESLKGSQSLPFSSSNPRTTSGSGRTDEGSGGSGGSEGSGESGGPKGELGYATIDFDRTAALSGVTRTKIKLDFHSASMDREREEGEDATPPQPQGQPQGQGQGSTRTKARNNSTAL